MGTLAMNGLILVDLINPFRTSVCIFQYQSEAATRGVLQKRCS